MTKTPRIGLARALGSGVGKSTILIAQYSER